MSDGGWQFIRSRPWGVGLLDLSLLDLGADADCGAANLAARFIVAGPRLKMRLAYAQVRAHACSDHVRHILLVVWDHIYLILARPRLVNVLVRYARSLYAPMEFRLIFCLLEVRRDFVVVRRWCHKLLFQWLSLPLPYLGPLCVLLTYPIKICPVLDLKFLSVVLVWWLKGWLHDLKARNRGFWNGLVSTGTGYIQACRFDWLNCTTQNALSSPFLFVLPNLVASWPWILR